MSGTSTREGVEEHLSRAVRLRGIRRLGGPAPDHWHILAWVLVGARGAIVDDARARFRDRSGDCWRTRRCQPLQSWCAKKRGSTRMRAGEVGDPHTILAILRFSDDIDPLILGLEIVRFSRFTRKCRRTQWLICGANHMTRADHHTRVRRASALMTARYLASLRGARIRSKWKLAAFCRICQDSR